MIKIVQFERAIRSGSSLPLVMRGNDDQLYVLKPFGSGEGVEGAIVEFLASRFALEAGLPVLPPTLVYLPSGFQAHSGDQEVEDLLLASEGVNFATAYLPDIRSYKAESYESIRGELRARILLLDIILLNIDRTRANPNLLFSDGELRCQDYASSLVVRGFVEQRRYTQLDLLRPLKSHPFYISNPDPRPLLADLRRIDRNRVKALVYAVPDQWIHGIAPDIDPEMWRKRISAQMLRLTEQDKIVRERIGLLKALHLESDEEKNKRSADNRAQFEKKYGKI